VRAHAVPLRVVRLRRARKALHKWLNKHSAENVVMFEVAYAVDVRLAGCTNKQQASKLTLELGSKYLLEECPSEVDKVTELLREKAEIAASELADRCLPKFVQSKGCLPLIEQLVGADATPHATPRLPDGQLWDPTDGAGGYGDDVLRWLHGVISMGLALPAMLTITDMTAAGNPLIFVNDCFCETTGYSRESALGRNCRFLQGPDTEAQSVAVIQAAMSDITDCVVKITNYRKTGEPFDMLLALRPVVDADQTRRFCIGMHFELTPTRPLKQLVTKLGKLVKLFPSQAPLESIGGG
jgi:PAS domain S-box-containing protein